MFEYLLIGQAGFNGNQNTVSILMELIFSK